MEKRHGILEMKLVANSMAISLMNEMIRNEDKRAKNETDEDLKNKTERLMDIKIIQIKIQIRFDKSLMIY